jgi:hypothetical protein
MAKNISKSVRLSEEVFTLVDNRPEEGFNNKFESMVLEFYRSASDREHEIYKLDQYISGKREQLQDLIIKINKLSAVADKLQTIVYDVNNLEIVTQKLKGNA